MAAYVRAVLGASVVKTNVEDGAPVLDQSGRSVWALVLRFRDGSAWALLPGSLGVIALFILMELYRLMLTHGAFDS